MCCQVHPRGSSTKWKLSSSCKDARVASTEYWELQVLRRKQSKVWILGWDVRRQQQGGKDCTSPTAAHSTSPTANCTSPTAAHTTSPTGNSLPNCNSAVSTVPQVHKTCATSVFLLLQASVWAAFPSAFLPLQVYELRSKVLFSFCKCMSHVPGPIQLLSLCPVVVVAVRKASTVVLPKAHLCILHFSYNWAFCSSHTIVHFGSAIVPFCISHTIVRGVRVWPIALGEVHWKPFSDNFTSLGCAQCIPAFESTDVWSWTGWSIYWSGHLLELFSSTDTFFHCWTNNIPTCAAHIGSRVCQFKPLSLSPGPVPTPCQPC